MPRQSQTPTGAAWRKRLWVIIFEADTPAGKAFDVALLLIILLSIAAVMMESVDFIADDFGPWLYYAEWGFTAFFTVEYGLRLLCVERPLGYARSFFGVVDLLAVIPTYLSLLFPGAQSLLIIRSLRLLRIFRVFKLGRFLGEADVLMDALHASRHKIIVFLGTVMILLTIFGSTMYLIEGGENGFTSIPRAIYWAVVTMTTVGYGDIAPQTVPGQILAAAVMIMGYSILAVPTGIVTAEIVDAVVRQPVTTRGCPECMTMGHLSDARFCKDCGAQLHANEAPDSSP
ncbi:MAG: ion transporter [Deltaproteobacteria bacterium]|nr:ion transporter [Deltaproteobacteria bacterium]MBW2417992.1 ion transporter [Deltaproteobacteria bacterium]